MIKNLAIAIIGLLVLSGCSSTKKSSGNISTSSEASLISDFERNVGDRVFFDYDSSSLSASSKTQLEKQAEWLKTHPSMSVVVEGHCDERGTREYNLALGERRAEAAKKYLLNQGIEARRLSTISYGKERPAVIGNNEDGWKQNRRSVTVVSY